MAGFLRSHGVLVSLAFSLSMAVPLVPCAAGAEPGNRALGQSGRRDAVDVAGLKYSSVEESTEEQGSKDELRVNEFKNPSRLFTDGVNEGPLDASDRPEKQHDTVLPQPDTMEKPTTNSGMLRSDQASAPADGPSPSGSTNLAISSFLTFLGVTLLGLFVA